MRLFFTVAERGVPIPVTREHLLLYAGPSQVIASALMYRLFCKALDDLSPAMPPERTDISVLTAFPGSGVLDCIEYVTRCRTLADGRLVVDTTAGHPGAPAATEGRFYFEVEIAGRRQAYWPVQGYFDETFLHMVAQFQDKGSTPAREAAYQDYKQQLVGRLLGAPDGMLFQHASVQPTA